MNETQNDATRLPMIVSRRRILGILAAGAGGAIFAACGGSTSPSAPPAPTIAPQPTTAPAATGAAPTAAATRAASSAPSGTASVTTGAASAPAGSTAAGTTTAAANGKYPSPLEGVPDAWDKLPPSFKAVAAVPGKGSKVTILHAIANGAPPVPRDQNKYWQELEKRLGVTYEPTFVPSGAFDEKFAAVVASGDLPDLVFLSNTAAQLQAIQQGAFTDLTPYLTGDGLKEFPNLATISPQIYKNLSVKGKPYGVPGMRSISGSPLMFRLDWMESLGRQRPKNADEFFDLMVAFTKNDPDGNGKPDTYGLGSGNSAPERFSLRFIQYMFRVPNEWRLNADGTLTHAIETDETKQAIAYMNKLYAAGVYYPDAATMNLQQSKDGFAGGKFGGYVDAVTALSDGVTASIQAVNPKARITGLTPPGFDGGKAVTHNSLGWGYYLAISAKAGKDKERAKELLRVLDYFCAPFGSEEWRYVNYGIEGVHHTVQPDGSPVRTMQGEREIADFKRTANGPQSYYYPTFPGLAKEMQGIAQQMVSVGVNNPTTGIFSPTNASKGTELTQLNTDRMIAIVTGRDPVSAIDTWIKDWRSRGGDQIRKDFQDGLKA